MEISEPDPSAATGDTTTPANRRRSGRVIRKPELYSADNVIEPLSDTSNAKRKRGSANVNAQQDEDDLDASEESDAEESEGEADEEELKDNRRRPRPKKPAAKKLKVAANGTATAPAAALLAIRPAPTSKRAGAKRAKKPRVRQSQAGDAGGVYAKIFSQGLSTDDVLTEWLRSYQDENNTGVSELVNFILKCTGGELTVDVHDIEDVDNVAGRLGDLQDEYQALKLADYPLISRNKQYLGFRDTLGTFFSSFIEILHSSDTLYDDGALIENIQNWVSTMSSAPIRPFRHTATIISLSISNALCDIALKVQNMQSDTQQQLENERKHKRVNKEKVTFLDARVKDCQAKLETIDNILRDSFDTVFVHRYRDVDPKIRAECVVALGYWIAIYQNMFFEGQYLRYLGWVLSDTASNTRAEVVKQLRHLFGLRGSIARLKAFTDRFRSRMVEMAARDADPAVRASTAELLDVIRNAGLLEPDDVDTVGQLIFDVEPRVRKGVAKFFVSNITDVYLNCLRDILNAENPDDSLEEYFPNDDDDDLESPKSAWIKFKCLAETLTYYDSPPEESPLRKTLGELPGSREVLNAAGIDSRFTLAAQAIYPHMPEIHHWEWLAGYLLFDHSQISDSADQDDIAGQLKAQYKLEEGLETKLLEILVSAVPLRILQVTELEKEKGKKTKGRKGGANDTPEAVFHNLTQIIPRLLSKYGEVPAAASAVLRLEHVLDLSIIEQSQQGSTTHAELLDKINQQFLGHSDINVLAEASAALLRAKAQDDLAESTEDKLSDLWTETLSSLRSLAKDAGDLASAGNLPAGTLQELVSTVTRIANLASISDPTEELLKTPIISKSAKSSRSKNPPRDLSPLKILQLLVSRGETTVIDNQEADDTVLEDTLVITSLRAITFYFMWSIRSTSSLLSSSTNISVDNPRISSLLEVREAIFAELHTLLQVRSGLDPVRLAAAKTLLDLHTVFGTLRQVRPAKNAIQADNDSILGRLIKHLPSEDQALIGSIFTAAEKNFAKKTNRELEKAVDDEPEDDDDEPEDDDDDEDEDETHKLLAEQSLCEITGKIVLAIVGRVMDVSGPDKGKLKQRLLRNQGKLGQNYKEVVKHLLDPKVKQKSKAKEPSRAKEPPAKKSEALVVEDDDIDDEAIEGQREEDGEEDLRQRGLADDEDDEGGGGATEQGDAAVGDDADGDEIMGD